jgi:hypothetical protein
MLSLEFTETVLQIPEMKKEILPDKLFSESRPGIRSRLIRQFLKSCPKSLDPRPYLEEMNAIEKELLTRQQRAGELEPRAPAEAAALHEELLADGSLVPHSYLWLVQYYQQQAKPQQVLRVCQTYIDHYNACKALDLDDPEYMPFVSMFLEIARNTDSG